MSLVSPFFGTRCISIHIVIKGASVIAKQTFGPFGAILTFFLLHFVLRPFLQEVDLTGNQCTYVYTVCVSVSFSDVKRDLTVD